MATQDYLSGRQQYGRPQAMLWSDNYGVIDEETGLYVPDGYEIGATNSNLNPQFLILSDDNRSDIAVGLQRIENRQRMVNGRMRSFFIADKNTFSVSWEMLPSRSYASSPLFNTTAGNASLGKSPMHGSSSEYTTDGGAGGVEIIDWYENHTGPFYIYLAYDKYNNFSSNKYSQLGYYNEIVQVYISSFSYNVVRRGTDNYDFFNISVTLEEV